MRTGNESDLGQGKDGEAHDLGAGGAGTGRGEGWVPG